MIFIYKLFTHTPSEIIMSAWRGNSAHLSRILSIKPQKSRPKQDADHIIWSSIYQAGAFMLYISKY